MRAPTTWRKIATIRCICNAGLHHCNGQMYLQPSVAPPTPVWARIARPFIPDVIITLRAGARRVIGATAKPLYPIDGKAVGLDRRSPSRPPSSREGDRPAGGGRSSYPIRCKAFAPAVLSKKPFPNFICFICIICPTHIRHMMFFFSFFELLRHFSANTTPGKNNVPRYPAQPFSVK